MHFTYASCASKKKLRVEASSVLGSCSNKNRVPVKKKRGEHINKKVRVKKRNIDMVLELKDNDIVLTTGQYISCDSVVKVFVNAFEKNGIGVIVRS